MKDIKEIPEKYWRFPTAEAIENLSRKLNLPNSPLMQDWEWEVADSDRIEEFYGIYKSDNLTDDEKFTIMETIIQSVEESKHDLENYITWKLILESIENNRPLHLYSVWYWSDWENKSADNQWSVTKYCRKIFMKHYDEIK